MVQLFGREEQAPPLPELCASVGMVRTTPAGAPQGRRRRFAFCHPYPPVKTTCTKMTVGDNCAMRTRNAHPYGGWQSVRTVFVGDDVLGVPLKRPSPWCRLHGGSARQLLRNCALPYKDGADSPTPVGAGLAPPASIGFHQPLPWWDALGTKNKKSYGFKASVRLRASMHHIIEYVYKR